MNQSAVRLSDEFAIVRDVEPLRGRVRFAVALAGREIAEYFVDPAYETPDDADLLLEHARRKHALVSRGGLRLIAS